MIKASDAKALTMNSRRSTESKIHEIINHISLSARMGAGSIEIDTNDCNWQIIKSKLESNGFKVIELIADRSVVKWI